MSGLLRNPQPPVDYSTLLGACSNRAAVPSDLDGILERNGQFLVIECKAGSDSLSTGQRIMLEALARIPSFTVLLVWLSGRRLGNSAHAFEPMHIQRIGIDDLPNGTDITDFRERLACWFEMASKRTKRGNF
jgi:hypothetical protein